MFTLTAFETTTVLPNPQFSDTEALTDSVKTKRAMDGTTYTYAMKKGRRKLQWTFQLTRNKALELQAFYRSYSASQVQVTDHNDRVWSGHFMNNPLEIVAERKAGPPIQGWPVGETWSVTVEFEGEEQ